MSLFVTVLNNNSQEPAEILRPAVITVTLSLPVEIFPLRASLVMFEELNSLENLSPHSRAQLLILSCRYEEFSCSD